MLGFLALIVMAEPPLGPVLPAGANPEFHQAMVAVEQRLYKSDWQGAAKAMALLPKQTIVVRWDDSGVDPNLRQDFAAARDRVLKMWAGVTRREFQFSDKNPDIAISFKETLPPAPNSSIPAGAALFVGTVPVEPRLELIIATKRGEPLEPVQLASVGNEVAYAVGYYFGLNETPFLNNFMGRTDLNYAGATVLYPFEQTLSQRLLQAVEQVRDSIHKHRRLTPAKPASVVTPITYDAGQMLQGDKREFSVQITNTGNAPLVWSAQPDCGCLTPTSSGTVPPGSSGLMKVQIDSREFVGQVKHNVLLSTNDPENARLLIPVKFFAVARYKFILPNGVEQTLERDQNKVEMYLTFMPGTEMVIKDAEVSGPDATLDISPWQGTLADPEANEDPMPRQGYKLTLTLNGALLPGRTPATISIKTDSPQFPVIRKAFYLQRGILAMPDRLFVGEVGKGPRQFSFLVSRPHKPFKILKVESDLPFFTANFKLEREDWEYKVDVNYDGKGVEGPLKGSVTVTTDDPDQPKIVLPIQGAVR